MPLSTRIADDVDSVDVIICGGGTAGCVVAARLAQADPNLTVLLIERGANNEGKGSVHQPILMPLNLVPDTKTALFYQGKKADAVNGRAITVQTGGVLGGGSSINFMLYSRAQGVDFDSWNMPGWSGCDMVPFMAKLETYHGTTDNAATHGRKGPVQISDGGFRGVCSQDDFLNAASELGYEIRNDMQDPTTVNNGFQEALRYVTPEGRRHDAASAYIHPLLEDGKHPNLHVLCESRVTRVLFDDEKRACGVEYTPDPHTTPAIPDHSPVKSTVRAKKLVVLSSGALGTPLILERSGVGSANVLQGAGISQVVDLPGVGNNYIDHSLVFWPWTTNLGPYDTGDALLGQRMTPEDAAAHGMMGWNTIDVHGKLRPTENEVAALGPEFQKAWERDYKQQPNRPLMLSATVCFFSDPSAVPAGAYLSVASYTAYSYSRGYIHVTGPDVEDPIDFDPCFLSDPEGLEVKMHSWHYKKLRQIVRSTDMYTGELALGHPQFPEGSAAAVKTDTNAASVDANPEYTAEDDAAIEQHIRNNVATTWHLAGTAKMASMENQGVVDEKLNVYGVSGLKCIDLSIMPTMVAANTNNTAYVIGEKGADIILRELGLA